MIKEKYRSLIFYSMLAGLGVLIVFTFYLGAYYSCNNGGGTLNKLSCKNPTSLGYCYDVGTDNNYIVDDYYKELNADGTLSKENYTKEYIEGLTK